MSTEVENLVNFLKDNGQRLVEPEIQEKLEERGVAITAEELKEILPGDFEVEFGSSKSKQNLALINAARTRVAQSIVASRIKKQSEVKDD